MEIHRGLLEQVKPSLADVGIRLTQEYAEWDAKEDYSTSRLMDAWLPRSDGCEAYLVFVSAFGGFAHDMCPSCKRRSATSWSGSTTTGKYLLLGSSRA